jgi:exopolyphosphatase/guanosine-5'-triphosphate,3'-diphosphate pyrophosphatase
VSKTGGTKDAGKGSWGKILSRVDEVARAKDPDPAHNEQVTRLALALFDQLRPLHGYGRAARRLLEIAGRLHDIGWSRVVSGKHHKLSSAMILDSEISGLDPRDRLTCALVARYHTKALPDVSRHRRFASLSSGRRKKVRWLAGILRVADGLDNTHNQVVKEMHCEISPNRIILRIETSGDCSREAERARQKKDLLVRMTGREIEYRC